MAMGQERLMNPQIPGEVTPTGFNKAQVVDTAQLAMHIAYKRTMSALLANQVLFEC